MKNIRKTLYVFSICSLLMCLCACGSDEEVEENRGIPIATATPTPASVKKTDNEGVGTGDTFTIPVYMNVKVEEYEVETNQVGSIVENQIYCGERYKMTLDGSVYGRDEFSTREIELEINVSFNQGDAKLTELYYVGDNFVESDSKPGVYTAVVKISKNTDLDFSKGYFVLGVDEINKTERSATQQIIVELKENLPEDSKDKVQLKINNALEEKLTNYVTVLKGDFEFSEEKNVRYGIGREVEETTVKFVDIPEQCQGITVAFYDDKKRQIHYGTTEILLAKQGENTIAVVLADYVKKYKGGEDEFEEMLSNGSKTFYLTVTALGGDSYHDVSFDMEYTFE